MSSIRLPFRVRSSWMLLPFLVACIAYLPSLGNGFAIIDDGLLIFENNLIRTISPQTLWVAFTSYDPELYIPLTFVSYQIDYLIGGYHPFPYHFTSLLLHAGTALLVARLFLLLSLRRDAAIFCGMIFALHPLHVEAVAWAAARKDVLSSFFFLGSLVTYVSFVRYGTTDRRKNLLYAGSLLLFLLALLSKVTAVSLPLLLIAVHGLLAGVPRKKIFAHLLPFFALSLLFGIVALGGKSALIAGRTPVEFLLLACKTTIFSLMQILFPFRLSVFYPELKPITLIDPLYSAAVLLLLFLSVALFRLRAQKQLLFGALFFFVTLAPSFLAVVKGGNTFFFSDRYAYLPSIGVLLIVTSLIQGRRFLRLQHARAACGFLLCLLTFLTIRQSLLWGNSTRLFIQAADAYPDFYLSHINLGASLRKEGKLDDAIQAFRTAIALHPLPNTYGLIGQIEAERGNYVQSVKEFESGLLLLPSDPELLYGLGQVYALMGESQRAQHAYEQALAATTGEASTYRTFARRISARRDMILLRMGILAGQRGAHAEAVAFYEQALEENPYNAEAHYNLAVGLGNLGRTEEAILHYEETIQLHAHHIQALTNLGILYERSNRRVEAVRIFREILDIDPANATANAALRSLGVM